MTKRFWKSGAAENSCKIGFQRALVISIVAFSVSILTGCLVPSQEALKQPSWPSQRPRTSESDNKPAQQALVKPFIPPETETGSGRTGQGSKLSEQDLSKSAESRAQTQSEQPVPEPEKPAAESSRPAAKEPEPESSTKTWEDEKVKALALELAKAAPSGAKAKVCYAVKKDEWWVILYEDAGTEFNLKQYTWNREQNKLEEFLVLKTVPKDKIEENLRASEPGRACEVLEIPKKEAVGSEERTAK
jgi:hypothetical protein